MYKNLLNKLYPIPYTLYPKHGFTLIELLVVVAIIAIISVVAIALFGNATAQARNGKRVAELEQIANALEQNRTSSGATPGYQPITSSQFASGNFPGCTSGACATAVDPQGVPYCVSANATSTPPTPIGTNSPWTAAAGCPTSPVTYSTVGTANIPAAGSQSYRICTIQEGLSGAAATVRCRSNLQ